MIDQVTQVLFVPLMLMSISSEHILHLQVDPNSVCPIPQRHCNQIISVWSAATLGDTIASAIHASFHFLLTNLYALPCFPLDNLSALPYQAALFPNREP